MRKILSIIALLAMSLNGIATRVYSFTAIADNLGLSSNCVKTILRDSYDFMWFGTKNGLDRYDGRTLRHYNCYDHKLKRGNNNIGALYEDVDKNLWVGTDRGVYKFSPRTETFTYIDTRSKDGISADDWVQEICGDKNGNIWVLIPNQGLFCFNGGKVDFFRITSGKGDKGWTPASVTATEEGDVYVGTTKEGLFRFDNASHHFKPIVKQDQTFDHIQSQTIQMMREYGHGKLLLATETGELYRFNPRTLDIRPVAFGMAGNIFLRCMLASEDEIWVGTHNGIYIINEADRTERYLSVTSPDVNGLTDNVIYTMYMDGDHNIWLGTMFGGVSFYQRDGFAFERFLRGGSPNVLSSNRIRGMAQGVDSKIYIGTEDGGMNIFDPVTGFVTRPVLKSSPKSTSLIVRSFGNNIYSGLSREGLEVIGAGGAHSEIVCSDLLGPNSSAYSVLIDKKGNTWVGADWGLFRRGVGESTFTKVKELGSVWVFDLCEASDGKIWIAGMGDGVWTYNPKSGKYTHYEYDENHSNGLRSNSVSAIMEDRKHNIWISTDRGGLSRYNPKGDNFVTIDKEDGLPDNVVYDILEDSRGFLWFGTNKGLVKYNPQSGSIKVFTKADGLSGNQFNYHSAVAGNDGMFYFGTINGLVSFNPDLDVAESIAPVYFTSLKFGNTEMMPGQEGSPITESLMFCDRIELPHDASHISIAVASPHYGNSGSLHYCYRLQPLSDDWITLPPDQNISFASLGPGNYTLDVKVNGEGGENIKSLTIFVPHPWYSSIWAWIFYILLIGIIAFSIWFVRKRRLERANREREYMFKMRADKEIYENKVKFFSEIAHEIKTPLTLIETPLEAIEEIGVNDTRVERYLAMMRKNITRLLELVGQLLDFHKIGNSRDKLNFEYVNVTSLVNDIVARFQDSITLRGKTLTVKMPENTVHAMIDKEAVTKIISNLLTNAMKYGDKKIEAELSTDGKNLTFKVRSDGNKITGADVYSIFTPFYQIKVDSDLGGVGIGLPLARVLASMHNGSLDLEADETPDNTFVLVLPLQQDGIETPVANADPVLTGYVMEEEPHSSTPGSGYSLLLVEDNSEMRAFLSEQLSRYFVVETAENGKSALKLLANNRYDIIVTDIMMPEMDGYEFCEAVKADVELSHIPIVFLTAKNDLDSKVRALKCGGEAYIEKPFSIKYFRQQVLSLLENRKHERRSLLKKPFFTVDNMQLSKADEEFMNKVVQTIQDHIADDNFNVETMSDVLCMSRSSLLRKIKVLFNLSPVELIRLVKLKKSAELIKEGKYRIGDICYMVGINSPSYFSKLFLKQFGMTPKAFEMQCQKSSRENQTEDTLK